LIFYCREVVFVVKFRVIWDIGIVQSSHKSYDSLHVYLSNLVIAYIVYLRV